MAKRLRTQIPALRYGWKLDAQDIVGPLGLPQVGDIWYVDADNGSDSNSGDAWGEAFATLTAAEDAAASNNYDVIVVAPGGTSGTAETAAITWDKNHITVIGASAPAPFSPRARVLWSTADTVSGSNPLINVTGQGNRFVNLQFATFADNNVLFQVTGNRNYFSGVHFSGIGDATAGDDTNARSLVLSGAEECLFEDCTVGLDTVARSVANAEIELKSATTRVVFRNSRIVSFADNAAHLMVKAASASDVDRMVIFEDCIFHNAINSTATTMTVAMDLHASLGGSIILFNSWLFGATDWADDFTNVEVAGGVQATGSTAGLMVAAA